MTESKKSRNFFKDMLYVVFYDEENAKRLGFFGNNFELPAATVARLSKCRCQVELWQVELFFKWIKRHPRIKATFGTRA